MVGMCFPYGGQKGGGKIDSLGLVKYIDYKEPFVFKTDITDSIHVTSTEIIIMQKNRCSCLQCQYYITVSCISRAELHSRNIAEEQMHIKNSTINIHLFILQMLLSIYIYQNNESQIYHIRIQCKNKKNVLCFFTIQFEQNILYNRQNSSGKLKIHGSPQKAYAMERRGEYKENNNKNY